MTPSTDLPRLDPPQRLLAGPGPSNVEPAVLEAMQKPMLGHLDPDLHEILLELVDFQRRVYNAEGGLVFPHQATGSSGMECGLVNLLEPGDTAIVAVTGFFGNRIARMAERTGAKVVEVRADYGQIAPNEALLDAIDQNPDARLVAVVHAETSTGVRHPVAELGRELKRRGSDTLLFVDCVTSLGAHPVEFDEWGIDFAYSCTQKALAAPPGMSPLAISDRALERVAARRIRGAIRRSGGVRGATRRGGDRGEPWRGRRWQGGVRLALGAALTEAPPHGAGPEAPTRGADPRRHRGVSTGFGMPRVAAVPPKCRFAAPNAAKCAAFLTVRRLRRRSPRPRRARPRSRGRGRARDARPASRRTP